jgi:hypothetical protein
MQSVRGRGGPRAWALLLLAVFAAAAARPAPRPWTETLLDCSGSNATGVVNATLDLLVGDEPAPQSLWFLQQHGHSFAPQRCWVELADAGGWRRATVAEASTNRSHNLRWFDPLAGLGAQLITVQLLSQTHSQPRRQARLVMLSDGAASSRSYAEFGDLSRSWQFCKVVRLLEPLPPSLLASELQPAAAEVGTPLSALPAPVRNKTWLAATVARQAASGPDPVLSALPTRELGGWDPLLQGAALPLDFQRILLGGDGLRDPATPAFAYQDGSFVVAPHATAAKIGSVDEYDSNLSQLEQWVKPAVLLPDGRLVVPAPLSASAGWRHAAVAGRGVGGPAGGGGPTKTMQRLLPQYSIAWGGAASADGGGSGGGSGISLTLASQRLPALGSAVVVSVQVGEPPGARLVLGVAAKPGSKYTYKNQPEDGYWAALRAGNSFELASGEPRVLLRDGQVVLVSSHPLRLLGRGVCETRIEVLLSSSDQNRTVHLAAPQSAVSWPVAAVPTSSDFAQAQTEFEIDWADWFNRGVGGLVELPGGSVAGGQHQWTNRIDGWLVQLRSTGVISAGAAPPIVPYGTGDVYGGHYYGFEEWWTARALLYFGVAAEARTAVQTLTDPAVVASGIAQAPSESSFLQARHGLALRLAAEAARLDCSSHQREEQQHAGLNVSRVIGLADWILQQRVRRGGGAFAGLLPVSGGYDFPGPNGTRLTEDLYADMSCWRGLAEAAAILNGTRCGTGSGRATKNAAAWLQAAADQFRRNLTRLVCTAASNSSGLAPFVPLALPVVGNTPRETQGAWGLWANMALQMGLFQYSTARASPWSGACTGAGAVGDDAGVLPSSLLTDRLEQEGASWGGLFRRCGPRGCSSSAFGLAPTSRGARWPL